MSNTLIFSLIIGGILSVFITYLFYQKKKRKEDVPDDIYPLW